MNLREETPRMVYLPVSQPRDRLNRLTLALRTNNDPAALIPPVRRQIDALDPNILISEVMTMRQQVDATLVQERLLSTLSAFFGILALMLSAIGLYGTLSHMVIQRTDEIGIRVALGADRGALIWMILRRSLAVVFAGIAVGLPVALLAARPVQALLYGLRPTDFGTIILGTVVLLAAALAASYLPARRASQIDPIIALRYE
jgi:ABC-type antimicrobial peptide transport system permease subunit